MNTPSIRPVAIKIDDDTRNRVERRTDARQRSSHWLMLEAIRQYVERKERREAFRQDGIRAWNESQATGLHATGDEIMAWLDTRGEENEQAAPACHK